MSQITRCPSCATSFKVVADQLRISEGWVRCGQCKEVFDACAHLWHAASPVLLPDGFSLTEGVRAPPLPAARGAQQQRAWGGDALSAPLPPAATDPGVSSSRAAQAPSIPAELPSAAPAHVEPVLAVPEPALPAFLAAGGDAGSASGESLRVDAFAHFAWRSRESTFEQQQHGHRVAGEPHAAKTAGLQDGMGQGLGGTADPSGAIKGAPAGAPPAAARSSFYDAAVFSQPAGYELPFADLRDDDDPALWCEPAAPGNEAESLSARAVPERPMEGPDAPEPFPEPDSRAVPGDEAMEGLGPFHAALPGEHAQGSATDQALQPPGGPPPPALALMADDSPAAVLQAKPRKSLPEASPEGMQDADEGGAEDEVSFVVAARRKAFWRRPSVRAVLAALVLACLGALALQVTLQERDRIVAMDARAQPWLMALCAQLGCEIAPPRQIDDVVIDSSSFHKARGDSYQLALTMKNKAAIPLAPPAVELTLTDVQDQAVLRRVLLPADLGAPAALAAHGEWAASVSVIVTTGGARVAGYRLLAFYP